MNFFSQLFEQVLKESLQDVYSRYYQGDFDYDEFIDILSMDPTFNQTQDRLGVYGKWLLVLASRGDLPTIPIQKNELTNQLTIFNQNKSGYEAADRDIGRIKNLQQLIELNQKYDSANSSTEYIKASQHEGVEPIGQSANWEVYRHTSYSGSRYLRGSNACWCTGQAGHPQTWQNYNKDCYLIIFINKNNRDIKYQGAFLKPDGTPNNSYLNRNFQPFDCVEFKDARNDAENFEKFIDQNSDVKAILQKSKYSQLITNISDKLAREKRRKSKTAAIMGLINDGCLVIDQDIAKCILDHECYWAEFDTKILRHELFEIEFSDIDNINIIDVLCRLFTNDSNSPNIAQFKSYIFDNLIGKISIRLSNLAKVDFTKDDMLKLMERPPQKIIVNKKSKIICQRVLIPILKNNIEWI